MIDDKTRAAVYRELADEQCSWSDGELRDKANVFDPPVLTGDPILWRPVGATNWRHGIVEDAHHTRSPEGARWSLDMVEWKPARIPTPTQVVVDVPHPIEWGHRATDVEISLTYWDADKFDHDEPIKPIITRPEAEAMHNE